MKRNQWSAVVLAILLFGGGAVAGALAHRYYTATAVLANAPTEAFRQRYVSDMRSRLNLTAKQVDQLEDILDQTTAKFHAAHETCRPAIAQVREEQISDVKAILTPGQIVAYDRLVAERERRSKEQEASERQADQKEAAARKARLH